MAELVEFDGKPLKPKAARLLGLLDPEDGTGSGSWTWSNSEDTVATPLPDKREDSMPAASFEGTLTPASPVSFTADTIDLDHQRESTGTTLGSSGWKPDWPEPDDEYVDAMLRQRPHQPNEGFAMRHGQRGRSTLADSVMEDDPLAVWEQMAALPRSSAVPRGATNVWARRHGFMLPWDMLFVVQWVASLALTFGFFRLVYPLIRASDTAGPLRLAAWGISLLTIIAIPTALVLSVIASLVDTEAAEVRASGMPRDMYYVQTWGVPAIDPMSSVCRVCQVSASVTTRHCKRCNKCVAGTTTTASG
ncbi:hypothetical protein DL89DRAFT_59108 [Linderina pennispora]|uniref:Palmitoyltransferase n=1 Tax=Linderina pennispora TaxID=61395 RepID=A0A1Y1VZP2_9FUNG|nr:uncharacterized protein DL89DRAFT_59108 [Linderina pennispora]ORX66730.1 hypothetical protein DL89DRAFT_59108 [Linderina pennispora]